MRYRRGMDTEPSPDHRERLASDPSWLEDGHWITLLINHIPNRRQHIVALPQPPRAPVPSPTVAGGLIQPSSVQAAARIGLEVIHESLGARLRRHDNVNVIRAYVGGHQGPLTLGAAL